MEQVATGVYQVSRGVNAFIVDGDEGVTLIDTGLPGRHRSITDGLTDIGRSADDITAILLTHGHVDHVGGAEAIWTASGADVLASQDDSSIIRGDRDAPPPPVLDRVPFIESIFRLLPSASPVPVSHIVAESSGEATPSDVTVIDTPGHTTGHLSFLLDRDGGILFVGDAAAHADGRIKRGWFNRSTPAIDASIRKLGELEFDIACFGHSAPLRGNASAAFREF